MMIPKSIKAWVTSRIQAAGAAIRVLAKSGRPVELAGRAGAADEPDYQDQALLMQQYGFRSRPGAGSELLTLGHLGSPTQRVAVASETPGQGPTDQVDGEVEIYSQHGQRVQLQEDGGVRIQAGSGAVVWLRADGKVQISSGGGGVATLDGARLTVQDDLASHHNYVTGAPPIVGALIGGVVAVVTRGADAAFVLTLAVAPNPLAGDICLVTYSSSWGTAPLVSISGGGSTPFTASPTATNLRISCAALPVGVYTLTVTSVGIS